MAVGNDCQSQKELSGALRKLNKYLNESANCSKCKRNVTIKKLCDCSKCTKISNCTECRDHLYRERVECGTCGSKRVSWNFIKLIQKYIINTKIYHYSFFILVFS